MNNDNTPSRHRRGSSPPLPEPEQGSDERMNTNVKPERSSFDQIKPQQSRGDETRWQDDGGESGEVV